MTSGNAGDAETSSAWRLGNALVAKARRHEFVSASHAPHFVTLNLVQGLEQDAETSSA
jgi:hypothetical protein